MPGGQAVKTLYLNNLNERVHLAKLKDELQKLCAPYGSVQITASKSIKKRGQAFIEFNSPEQAIRALEALKSTALFAKPINAAFSNHDSSSLNNKASTGRKRRLSDQDTSTSETKRAAAVHNTRSPSAESPIPKQDSSKPDFGEPNSSLLLQQIPDLITVDDLRSKCQQYAGFTDARMFAARHVGFLEFESVDAASAAIEDISAQHLGKVTYARR